MSGLHGSIEARLKRLERRNHVLLSFGIILLVILVFSGFRRGHPAVLRAESFELLDASGRVRATMEVRDSGEAGLFVQDDSSRVRASVSHSDDQTALFIKDAAGDTRIGAAQFSHGGGGFALHGESMKGAAVLYMVNHQGSLRVFDQEGDVVYQIP